jgi:acyl dehydratase
MIDRRHIGTEFAPFTVDVERGRLRFFAKATGQTDPVYSDDAAALAAGHPALPVPPTFLFCLEMDSPNPAAIRELLGLDYSRILHGEQGFTFHRLAHAGDRLTFRQRITDIYDKKGGALEFIVRLTEVDNQRGERVAELRAVTVYRNPVPAAGAAADAAAASAAATTTTSTTTATPAAQP